MVKDYFGRSLFFVGLFVVALSYLIGLFNLGVTMHFFVYGMGMLLITLGGLAYYFVKKRDKEISTTVRILFLLIVFWHFFIIFHDFQWNYSNARNIFIDQYTFWPYLMLFLMPFGANIRILKKIFKLLRYFKYIWLMSLPYFLLNPELFSIAQDFFWMFGYGAGVLLILEREKKREKLLSLISLIGALIVFLIMARRSMVLTCLYILLFYFFRTFSPKRKRYKKISIIIIGSIFLLCVYLFVFNTGYFSLFTSRIDQNTRESVYEFFFSDLLKGGWGLYGKGMLGTYYAPLGYNINTSPYRATIETGYLHLILKGGYIELFLMCSLFIISIRRALTKGNNNLTKYAGLMLLGWLLDMAAFGLPAGNLMYMFIWIYVGIINSSLCKWPESVFIIGAKAFNNESTVVDKYGITGSRIR